MRDNRHYEIIAKAFCDAIRTMAAKPETIDNMESYLSNHFEVWLDRYANTPENLTYEFEGFAKM